MKELMRVLPCDERITACGKLVNIVKLHVTRGMHLIALYAADAQDALWSDSSTLLHK